jgi:hypothetical protein
MSLILNNFVSKKLEVGLGFEAAVAWIVVGLGVLVAAVGISVHFGKVRSKVP